MFISGLVGTTIISQLKERQRMELFNKTGIASILFIITLMFSGVCFGENKGSTLLHQAVRKGDMTVVKKLLDSGYDVNIKDANGLTPLHCAAQCGHKDIAEFLLANGADAAAKDENSWMPVHHAAAKGYKDLAKLLLKQPVRIDPIPEQISETVYPRDELHIWMNMLLKRCLNDYSNAQAEIEATIRYPGPVRDFYGSGWIVRKETDTYTLFISLRSESGPVTYVTKRFHLDKTPMKPVTKGLGYGIMYDKKDNAEYFTKFGGEGIRFYPDGKTRSFGFKLTDNRFYEARWDTEGKLLREFISKAPFLPSKPPSYQLYFPNQDDVDIFKNKLLQRCLCACSIAQIDAETISADPNTNPVRTPEYEMDYNSKGKVARFLRKSTGEEIVFYPDGEVKSFFVRLADDKLFKAEWDSKSQLVREGISRPSIVPR